MSLNAAGSMTRASSAAPSHMISTKPEPAKRKASPSQQSAFVSARPQSADQGRTTRSVLDVKL